MHESSTVAAMPPWTLPIGLNIHSVGSSEKTARPSATSRMSIPSIRPIGGAGNSPAAIACKNASPVRPSRAAAASASGSSHVNVRVLMPSPSQPRGGYSRFLRSEDLRRGDLGLRPKQDGSDDGPGERDRREHEPAGPERRQRRIARLRPAEQRDEQR